MFLENLASQGRNGIRRTMANNIIEKSAEIRKESIKKSLMSFKHEAHKMEHVATIHGIDFINDAFSTTVNSTWYALQEINKPIIWIAGGLDVDNNYAKLFEMAQHKVKALICLGTNNELITNSLSNVIEDIYETNSMKRAIAWGYKLANEGDVVLLSPACASFDLFADYEEKGNAFRKIVKTL